MVWSDTQERLLSHQDSPPYPIYPPGLPQYVNHIQSAIRNELGVSRIILFTDLFDMDRNHSNNQELQEYLKKNPQQSCPEPRDITDLYHHHTGQAMEGD